jgi:hypothetical protein
MVMLFVAKTGEGHSHLPASFASASLSDRGRHAFLHLAQLLRSSAEVLTKQSIDQVRTPQRRRNQSTGD